MTKSSPGLVTADEEQVAVHISSWYGVVTRVARLSRHVHVLAAFQRYDKFGFKLHASLVSSSQSKDLSLTEVRDERIFQVRKELEQKSNKVGTNGLLEKGKAPGEKETATWKDGTRSLAEASWTSGQVREQFRKERCNMFC